jgi:multidrug efflux pump subunit AcrA (membrane-fusion protein)
VARLEAEEREHKARLYKAQQEAEAKIAQARKAAAVAKTENEVALTQLNLARAELDREMIKTAGELAEMEKARGTRVTHPWHFELVDPEATIRAGGKRLLRIEVDHLACQDAVKAQLEIAPDKEPTLPGIKVTRETKVSIRATAQTS